MKIFFPSILIFLLYLNKTPVQGIVMSSAKDSKSSDFDALSVKFGPHLRSLFQLQEGYTNLNHGSYGSTPHHVTKAAHQWQSQVEACPDRWFRQTVYPELDKTRAELAAYVNADPMDLVFVENASHGKVREIRRVRGNAH